MGQHVTLPGLDADDFGKNLAQLNLLLRGTTFLDQDFIPVFIIEGQSNAAGADPAGSKYVNQESNTGGIWTVNCVIGHTTGSPAGMRFIAPTGLIRAAFGTPPFSNNSTGATDPALTNNNAMIHMLNNIRDRKIIRDVIPLIIIPYFAAGNTIRQFSGPGTPSHTALLDNLKTMLNVAETDAWNRWKKPIKIIYVGFSQHEADGTSNVLDTLDANGYVVTYGNAPNPAQTAGTVVPASNTDDGWLAQFYSMLADLRTLSQWHPAAIIGVDAPKLWAPDQFNVPLGEGFPTSGRYGAIARLVNSTDPAIGVVSSSLLDGMTQSHGFGSNHFSGDSLVKKGALHVNYFLQATSGASGALAIAGQQPTRKQLVYANGALISVNGKPTGESAQAGVSPIRYVDPEYLMGGATIDVNNTTLFFPQQAYIPFLSNDIDIRCSSQTGGPSILTGLQPFTQQSGPSVVSVSSITIKTDVNLTLSPSRSRWYVKSTAAINTPGFTQGGNIGTGQCAVLGLSGVLVADNTLNLSFALNGHTVSLAGTWAGGTSTSTIVTLDGTPITGSPFSVANIVTSDLAMAQFASALQAGLLAADTGWTTANITSSNMIGLYGTGANIISAISSTITGGASQGTAQLSRKAYALTSLQCNNVSYNCFADIRYVLPASNASTPCQVELIANGGGGTAGDIYIDCYSGDQIFDRVNTSSPGGVGGANTVTVNTNLSAIYTPDSSSRWRVNGGTFLALPSGPVLGPVTLGINPFRLVASNPLVTGSTLSLTGTITPSGGSATAFTNVSQAYAISSAATLTQAALSLQLALAAIVPGVTSRVVPGQNIIQIETPTGTALAITGSVTGGASPPTITQDAGIYNLSLAQCRGFSYATTKNVQYNLPNPNNAAARVSLMAPSDGSITIGAASGSLFNRTNVAVATVTLPLGSIVFYESGYNSRWTPTGGSYLVSVNSQYTNSGTTITLLPGYKESVVALGPAITSMAITLPTNPQEGDTVGISAQSSVTLTYAGGTTVGAPASLTSGTGATLKYSIAAGNKWLRV